MIKKKEIKFPNGNRAQLVRPAISTPAADNKIKLVENKEKTLEKELTGWIQTMEDTLS